VSERSENNNIQGTTYRCGERKIELLKFYYPIIWRMQWDPIQWRAKRELL